MAPYRYARSSGGVRLCHYRKHFHNRVMAQVPRRDDRRVAIGILRFLEMHGALNRSSAATYHESYLGTYLELFGLLESFGLT